MEWDEDEMTGSFPRTSGLSEWLGCFGKSETLSGSRLTARGHTRHRAASNHPTSVLSALPYLPPPLSKFSPANRHCSFCVFLLQKLHINKMGAIPEVDPDEPVETKPFKFVTGKSTQDPLPYANWGQSPCSRVNG